VLHYARLAEMAGGVDAFLIGSELRGLTWVRDGANGYPAVRALRRIAGECRQVLRPETALSYAADWSEWFGHQPADGSGHAVFHLDPLWADQAVSFVGVDWYPPGADWRDGREHLDALAGYEGPHDPAYLASQVAGGEGFDWFYTSSPDRVAQRRTPITDGAHGEPWMFRPKDIRGWWENAHHDRPDGVRSPSATAWVPRSKPVRLVEFGCPAVDKGANSPNLFYDPKSAESGLPPFSDGSRDDLGQRRAVEAVLAHFDRPENNPVSELYGGPMVDGLSAWCWDARPFPEFPGRPEVWADASNWTYGHWLNGRAGVAPAAELLAAVLRRGGVGPESTDLGEARGSVTGYVVDRPMSLREAVGPLLEMFGLDAAERDGKLTVVARDGPALMTLMEDDLALPDKALAPERRGRSLEEKPAGAQARFVEETGEYRVAAVSVTAETAGAAGVLGMELPVVIGRIRGGRSHSASWAEGGAAGRSGGSRAGFGRPSGLARAARGLGRSAVCQAGAGGDRAGRHWVWRSELAARRSGRAAGSACAPPDGFRSAARRGGALDRAVGGGGGRAMARRRAAGGPVRTSGVGGDHRRAGLGGGEPPARRPRPDGSDGRRPAGKPELGGGRGRCEHARGSARDG
jgi:hypothetical protein